VDISQPGGAEAAVSVAARRLGNVTGVVHAVGMSGRRMGDGPVSSCTDAGWSTVMRVNLESAFRLMRAAWPVLLEAGGGSIVLVGSALARSTDPDFLTAGYAASKAGLEGLARSAAREGASVGIRVNVVAVGLAETPMAGRALGDQRIAGRLADLQPLGATAVTPQEVAGVVAWLLSERSAATTGAVVPADRGWTLR
jgi:NAD(P)-dependent dehydrogenase (short-subunit alcohol dehydrogenase family)